ncbi:restriction endonuclease subunit S [Mycoplasma feriruminatoris]|uniref:Type I restriction modification DNA specificity domain-containing protein n=1 Tax=Mycoplasma feriruminatoris TaxID=1179777 RepID=A0AAX3TEE8_9MOLU|nr:restriction endonuclease subunit S [Mycoplasma feriruminatoris]WFQ92513.1 hypothetical protein MFERI14822_00291 [Mycoplasma feriruminatoris]
MKKVRLYDVLDDILDFSSKATYSGRNNMSLERNIPTLSALSVFQNYIDYSKCYYVSLDEYKKMTEKRIPKIGDILITKEAPVGRVAMLDKNGIAIGRRLWLLTGKENILNNDYLLYFLQWDKTQQLLRNISNGSTVKSINLNTFRNLEVEIHTYYEQVKIGNLLNLIDKKILLNNKINDNLTSQILNIYENWFIKFNFPGKNSESYKKNRKKFVYNEVINQELPINWEIQSIFENKLCEIISPGIDVFNKEKKYYATKEIQSMNIGEGEWIFYKNRKSRANMQPQSNSVWFAKMKNSIKHLFITRNMEFMLNKGVLSTGFCGLKCKDNSFAYIASFVLHPNFEFQKDALSHGATQQSINNEDLKNIKLIIPDEETLNTYHKLTNPMFCKITENTCETRLLINLKKVLLPLLMNGQVTIR